MAKQRCIGRPKKHSIQWGQKNPFNWVWTPVWRKWRYLSRRQLNEYADFSERYAKTPRPNPLEHKIADSKPMPWFTMKYKTRWLSDGSVVSGNPVFTNFLWNEIGRGTDLHRLEKWMHQNKKTVMELTAAVFASKAPRYTDFFPVTSLDLAAAKRGQKTFKQLCTHCHGDYQKAWEQPDKNLSPKEMFETISVIPPTQSRNYNVGTDPLRAEGMQYFSQELNQLKVSQWMKTKVKPQRGYLPPPLNGIWSRWPYFHNNSAPSLCAVLTPSSQRPKTYWAGEAKNPETDFDQECNGYPEDVPAQWKEHRDRFYDSSQPGLSHLGHDQGIFLKEGVNLLEGATRSDLIMFLKTL